MTQNRQRVAEQGGASVLPRQGCDCVWFACVDYRFQEVFNLLVSDGKADRMDWVAGGSGLLTDKALRPLTLAALKKLQDLHGISAVGLCNHRDCGGYGGSKRHHSSDREFDFHCGEMMLAADILRSEMPDMTVRFSFAELNGLKPLTIIEGVLRWSNGLLLSPGASSTSELSPSASAGSSQSRLRPMGVR